MKDDYFDHLVGQEHLKKRLNFYVNSHQKSGIACNVLAVAPRGAGKSEFCRSFLRALNKPAFELNCSSIKTVKQFMDFWFTNCVGKQVGLFLDELQNCVGPVQNFLLSILNPNRNNVNYVRYDGVNVEFNFRQVTFCAATTDRQKVALALIDRFTELTLMDYTLDEVGKIIRKNTPTIKIEDGAVRELSKYARGNGRSAAKLGEEIERYGTLHGVNYFATHLVNNFIKMLDLLPLGLTRFELNVLRLISLQPSITLTTLAARSGLSKTAQQDIESFLLKTGLIQIDGGRKITQSGREYLQHINLTV